MCLYMGDYYLVESHGGPHCSMYCLEDKCCMGTCGYVSSFRRGIICLLTNDMVMHGHNSTTDTFNSWFFTINDFSLNQACKL
jgi:hypothetical protein